MQKNKILYFLFILQSSLFVNLRRLQTIWLVFFVKYADSKFCQQNPDQHVFRNDSAKKTELNGGFNKIVYLEKFKKEEPFFERGEKVWL